MDNTQLPAEVNPSNDLESKIFNVLLHHSHANRTTAAKELAELFATEYATKLHEEQQKNAELKRWKQESVELLAKIHSYAHKNLVVGIGQCNVNAVIERCKQFDKARKLLQKFIACHEGGLLPDRLLYNEIKTFLDGTK